MTRAAHRREAAPARAEATFTSVAAAICAVFALNFLLTSEAAGHFQLGVLFAISAVFGGVFVVLRHTRGGKR